MSYASCCVLSYDRPAFLAECLTTLTQRAGAPLELIVHDDGSPDESCRELLHDAVTTGLVSSAILNPPGYNQGQGVALNRMFWMATGDPIIKIDHDLVFYAGWLAKVNELLAANPQIGLLSGFRYWHKPCDWRDTLIAEHDGWQEHEFVMGSFMAIRRACWEELGPFTEHSEAFAEDHLFQRKVTASPYWMCATPVVDLMENVGYGVGPSTVVPAVGVVQSIVKAPVIL